MLRRPIELAQYAAADYRKLLAKHGLIGSMSRRGNPYENAMAESFMKTLKVEAVYLMEYETFDDVTADLTVPAPSPVRFHPKLAEVYKAKVESLSGALSDPEIRDEAFEIIRGLIQRIIIQPLEKHSFEVEIIGEITKMLTLPDENIDLHESSTKVVAGARNRDRHLIENQV